MLLCFLGLLMRLFFLQIIPSATFGREAMQRQSQLIMELPPFRGRVVDRNGEVMALDLRLYSLGVRPRDIPNKDAVAKRLSRILGLDVGHVRDRISRDKEFVWVARKISKEKSDVLLHSDIPGLELRPEWRRVYPNDHAGAQLIGFTGMDHYGLEGIELHYDSFLKGIPGWKRSVKDARQRELVARQKDMVLPLDGYDIRMAMDVVIQHAAEFYLEAACRKFNALGGTVVVLDAPTGDLLALANYPFYDPNQPQNASPEEKRNRALTDLYEPGSVFKLITVSGALEEKVVSPADQVHCEFGSYRIGGRILHDVHPYGRISVAEVIAKSSNIGTAKIADKMGAEKLYRYMKRFGFGHKTGIDAPGEISGILKPTKQWSKPSLSTMAIGQEIGVTALQLAAAINALSNDGVWVKPRLVQAILSSDGRVVKDFGVEEGSRVVSVKTALSIREMMEGVVKSGTGTKAALPGIRTGGKTGTAQKLDPGGAYSHDHFISSFVGFVEVEGHRATIVVSVDDPHPQYYGGTVAAPVFQGVALSVAERWGAAPEKAVKNPLLDDPKKTPETYETAAPRRAAKKS